MIAAMRHESLFFLFSQITCIKGVRGATAKAIERLLPATTQPGSIPTLRDVLFHLPVGILDRRHTFPLSEVPKDPVIATFMVEVGEHIPPKQKRYGKQPYKVLCSNDTGDITLVFFNVQGDYLKRLLPEGSKRVISGRVEHFDLHLQMAHPDVIAPADKLEEVMKPEPVYPLTVGLTSRRIHKIVEDALAKLPELPEWISNKKSDWPTWKDALTQIHHPVTQENLLPLTPSRQRLAYDELLANQLHLAILRQNTKRQSGEVFASEGALVPALKKELPYALTRGQEAVIEEIFADMASGNRMARLLQGDVGSGKTIVALFAMLRAVEQGAQAALMVPTEIVAQQHYENISALLSMIDEKNRITLLTGNIKGKARKEALEAIGSGKAGIVIGTHALFQERVEFKNLALVVIDEQHRFGVNQRMALSAKGNNPHILHLTATPIPRSLAMTLYGDMDSSILKEKPAGRQPIATRVIPASRYDEVVGRLKVALDKGEKAYWICPLIEEKIVEGELTLTPEEDIAAAVRRFTEFKARFGDSVGLVHGRMKKDERNDQMHKFMAGEIKLLVATTVVEVGVDVRDATIMVIERAERFGLSQLHQLRGRVGRGDKPSSCVLLCSDNIGEVSKQRLSVLRESEDGFHIAEMDLAQRGSGELLGVRQSGQLRYVFSDLFHHQPLLMQARDEAARLISWDPELKSGMGQAASILLQLFERDVAVAENAKVKTG